MRHAANILPMPYDVQRAPFYARCAIRATLDILRDACCRRHASILRFVFTPSPVTPASSSTTAWSLYADITFHAIRHAAPRFAAADAAMPFCLKHTTTQARLLTYNEL